MKKINFTKIHGIIGKTLCGTAGAIVGFFIGGVSIALLGIATGILAGHLLERAVLSPSFRN